MKWWDVLINLGKDIFQAIRKSAWFLLPLSAVIGLIKWLFQDYLPARAKDLLGWLIGKLPAVHISPASVNVAWDRINQWVPVNEVVQYSIYFLTFAGAIMIVRTVRKFLPFS